MGYNTRLSLSSVPRWLRENYVGDPPTYRKIYQDVVDGRHPALQHNGRWYLAEADIPHIASAYRLVPRVMQPGLTKQPRSAA